MPSARLETTGQYLGVSIDGYDKVKDLAASQFYAYTFLIKNPGDDGTWYQINLADYLATEGTKREITNLKTNESNTYPGWTTSDDQTAFETNIPDTMIHQAKGPHLDIGSYRRRRGDGALPGRRGCGSQISE